LSTHILNPARACLLTLCGADVTQDAQSFGIKTIHFAPFDGGVLEYGVSGVGALTDTPLEATLKMQCEATNAAYAMYWKETAGVAVVAGRYVAPEHAAELRKTGKKVTFAEASQALTLVADETSGVGKVLINREPIFVQAHHPAPQGLFPP